MIEEKHNRAIVNDAIRQVFSTPAVLRCVRPAQPPPRRALRTNADVQPMIDRAIEFFDGEAVDLTALRTEAPPRRGESPIRKEKPSG